MNVYFRWLYLNTTDPDGQLAWLISTLQDAENKKEKVSGALTHSKHMHCALHSVYISVVLYTQCLDLSGALTYDKHTQCLDLSGASHTVFRCQWCFTRSV